MATMRFTSTFQRDISTSWYWVLDHESTSTSYWYTTYRSGPTVYANNYDVKFDISSLPANTRINKVTITFPWHNTSSIITRNLSMTISNTTVNLPSTNPSGTRYSLISFDKGVEYTLTNSILTVHIDQIKYTGTRANPETSSSTPKQFPKGGGPSSTEGSGGWFTGYNPSASPTGYSDEAVYIDVEYEYVYTKLSTPIPSVSMNPCLDSSTLSWTASVSSTGVNQVSSYEVYKNNTKIGSTTTTSFIINGNNLPPQGATANYSVKAINNTSQGGSTYDSDMSTSITLKRYGAIRSDYLSINFHSNNNSTNANPIYVGAKGQSGITITIVPHYDTPMYDSITSRTLTWKADESITTSSEISGPNNDGNWTKNKENLVGIYTLTVGYASGRSQSVSGEVKQLGAPAATTFTAQPAANAGITASSYTYSWNKVSLANSIINYVYTTHMYDSSGTEQSNSAVIDKTSYTLSIDTCGYGKKFWITILVRAYASYGGYTDAAQGTVSNEAFRVSPIGDIIVGLAGIINESDSTNTTYTYNKTRISWDYTPSTGQGALKTLKYEIDNSLNGTIAIPTGDSTTKQQKSFYDDTLIANLAAGTRSYSLIFTDEYGLTKTYTKTIIKVEPPKIALNSVSFNNTNYAATLNFTLTPPATTASPNDNIALIIEEGYKRGNEYYNDTSQTWNGRTSYVKELLVNESIFSKLYSKLVPTTGTPLGEAIITYRIKAYDRNIPVAIGYSNVIDKLIDFTITPAVSGSFSIVNATKNGMTYASSKDSISIDTTGIMVSVKSNKAGMSRNFSTRCSKSLQKEYTTSMALSNNKATDSVPAEWSTDTSWTYQLVASMNYLAENEISIITRTTTSAAENFDIRRWVTPVVNLRNLEYTTIQSKLNIRGTLQSLTNKWGRSLDTANITQIVVEINEGTANLGTFTILPEDIAKSNDYTFTCEKQDLTEIERNISATLIITSTSNQTYTVSIPAVKLKPTAIPFAIRQYGIGTNVAKEWNITKTEPALQIIGNQTPTVATFSNGSSQTTTDLALMNDATAGSTGKARLSLNKDGDNWTLSIFFD